MKTIWNLLEEELETLSLENIGYNFIENAESHCDVIICGMEHVEYVGALANPQECLFIIALKDYESEHHLVPNTFDVWMDIKSIRSSLPLVLETYKTIIEQKNKIRIQREIIERFSVNNSVHYANLDTIKFSMRDSTKEIENIFESRVEEMRSIHSDTKKAHEKLTILKDKMIPQEFEDLEESWNMTESILSRTDEVIKAMFGFITVLQCEDRITQMIDGIENIMDDDSKHLVEQGFMVNSSNEIKLKERLVEFYTIQDQRDYAQGIESVVKGCKPKQAEIEEFLLF